MSKSKYINFIYCTNVTNKKQFNYPIVSVTTSPQHLRFLPLRSSKIRGRSAGRASSLPYQLFGGWWRRWQEYYSFTITGFRLRTWTQMVFTIRSMCRGRLEVRLLFLRISILRTSQVGHSSLKVLDFLFIYLFIYTPKKK